MNENKLYSAVKMCVLLLLAANITIFVKFTMVHKFLLGSVTPHAVRVLIFLLQYKFDSKTLVASFGMMNGVTIACTELYTHVFERISFKRFNEKYSLTYVALEVALNVFIFIYTYVFIRRSRRMSDVLPEYELTNIERV